jgi:16S rRNA G527 N7-methylase RsmG
MKLVRPSLALTMVEAVAKKAAFLREAVHALDLAGTKVLTCRIEELPSAHRETADLLTMRGVRLDAEIALVCRSLLKPAGHLVTFGPPPELPGELFQVAGRRDFQAGQSSVILWAKV